MAFEKVVLAKVRKVFDRNSGSLSAEFVNGTLFVTAPENVARSVFSMLCKEYNFKVKPSKVGDNEFAYDFIA